jgi:hypothetical protein
MKLLKLFLLKYRGMVGRSKQNFFYIIIPFLRALPRIKRISEGGWGGGGVGWGGGWGGGGVGGGVSSQHNGLLFLLFSTHLLSPSL